MGVISKINSIMFNRYSFIFQMIILLLIINVGYPYYETHIVRTFNETDWITSPDGRFQVKALLQGLTLHRFVQLKVRVRNDKEDWFEISKIKVFTFPFFKRTFSFLDLKWKDRSTLLLGYYNTWTVEGTYEFNHRYYCEVVIK